MPPQSIHELVREARTKYVSGNTKIGTYVDFNMHDTLERIEAYLYSKHISGPVDSLGRDKPFFNIVTAAVNIWYRATDIDRKNIRFVPTKNTAVILAFVANVILQNWMDRNNFGRFLNLWGRTLARYGSAVTKWIERGGELIASVVPWNRVICDQIDFDALPRIEVLYKTPAQLRNMATPGHPDYAHYDPKAVDALINAHAEVVRKNLNRQTVDTKNDFIEIYEVLGLLDTRLLSSNPERSLAENETPIFTRQFHVVSYVQPDKRKKEYNDYTLYKGRALRDVYQKDDLIEEDGRTLAIGAVEHLFEAQWMRNHSEKNIKDTLDLASRIIMQTSDGRFAGRNVLTAIETGDILVHDENKPMTRMANDNPSIAAMQAHGQAWERLAQDVTATPESMRGANLPSGTSYQLGKYLGDQASSLFEIMTENKGLALEQMIRRFVIPYIKKQLKNKDQIVAILDDAGIQQIDSIYIPSEAVRRYNDQFKKMLLEDGEVPPAFDAEMMQGAVRKDLAPLGNKRFFVPSEIDDQTWEDIFSDFEWDSIRVEIVDENVDKRTILQTLSNVLQTIAGNPNILLNPNVALVWQAILRETGSISPMQLTSSATAPPPPTPLRVSETIAFKDMPPEAQVQALQKIGITMQLPAPSVPETGAQSPPQP